MGALLKTGLASSYSWQVTVLSRLSGWRVTSVGTSGGVEAFSRVVIDSRKVQTGDLFVAIRGQQLDGHDYVKEAIARGAAGVVLSSSSAVGGVVGAVCFMVSDTRAALADLARLKRRAFGGRVAALTGSAGKTSTKEFFSVLSGGMAYVTPGNWNNDIGVPLSIFAAPMDAAAWVLELGMNHAGEIGVLAAIVEADIVVMLPAGRAHIGSFSTAEQVVAAKAELLQGLGKEAICILANHQYDAWLPESASVTYVGDDAESGFAQRQGQLLFPEGSRFRIFDAGSTFSLMTPLHGLHWRVNLELAWHLCRAIGCPSGEMVKRTRLLSAGSGRMELVAWCGGWILDDSYNASPESFHALLDWVQASGLTTPRFLLGDMLELGSQSKAIHREVAARVIEIGAEAIVVGAGSFASVLADQKKIRVVNDVDEAVTIALDHWQPGCTLVCKGAHGSGLFDALRRRGVVA